MSWLIIFISVLWRLINVIFWCLVDGVIAFVFVAAIFGFFAWLFGATSPRDVALIAGTIVGGLWSIGIFLMAVGKGVAEFQKELQIQRINKLDDYLDIK